jgi:hypothetical protein
LLFCFAGLTLMGNAAMLDGWRQFGLLAATFTAMLLTAKLFSRSEAKQERQPVGAPAPVAGSDRSVSPLISPGAQRVAAAAEAAD